MNSENGKSEIQSRKSERRDGVSNFGFRISVFGFLVFGFLLFAASTAAALTPAELVGPDLEPHRVTIAGLRDGRLVYFDQQRRLRHEPISRFVQLRNIGDPAAAPAADPAPGEQGVTGRLRLTDGQIFRGQIHPAPASADDHGVYWQTPDLGLIRVPLDRITGIDLTAAAIAVPVPAAATGDDAVTLTNGDTLIGFIASITDAGIEFAPREGQALSLPLERIASLRLANPRTLPQSVDPRQSTITLRAGGQMRIVNLELAAERLSFQLPLSIEPQKRLSLPLAAVTRIDFTGAGWRLVDLTDQPMSITAGGEVFGLPMPPRAGAHALFLHAPITVSFDLPPQVRRFAATAELDLDQDLPPRAAGWADFQLVVQGDSEPVRFHFSADQPQARINLPLTGSTLRLELDPAANGPILDRLQLLRPTILLQLPTQQPTDSAE